MSNYYFTWEDLIGKYPAVAKDFQSGPVNSYWIPDAQGEVDAYLGSQFAVPFNPCPPIVKNITIDLCYYKMTYREPGQDALKKYVDQRLADILEKFQVSLSNSGQGDPAMQARVFNTTSGTGTAFGMDRPEDYRVDSGWQQSFASDRGDFV